MTVYGMWCIVWEKCFPRCERTEDLNVNYGSIVGKKEDADVFAAAVRGTVKVEVKMDY